MRTDMTRPHLHLDVVADVVCPWCFLGKRRLALAIDELAGEIDFTVGHHPFQLDPGVPKAGVPRMDYLLARTADRNAIDEVEARLADMGEDVGIRFAFDLIETIPNTLDAHRLIRWAGEAGIGDAMLERLFSLHFEEGADLSDAETLLAAADDVGLDEDEVAEKLDSDADREAVEAEIEHARKIGVAGVPCIIVERKYAISGAQSIDILVEGFRKIAAALEDAG